MTIRKALDYSSYSYSRCANLSRRGVVGSGQEIKMASLLECSGNSQRVSYMPMAGEMRGLFRISCCRYHAAAAVQISSRDGTLFQLDVSVLLICRSGPAAGLAMKTERWPPMYTAAVPSGGRVGWYAPPKRQQCIVSYSNSCTRPADRAALPALTRERNTVYSETVPPPKLPGRAAFIRLCVLRSVL